MSTLIEARDAYVVALNTQALSRLGVTISTHGGTFDPEQLGRYSKTAPAAVLSLLSYETDCTEGYLRCVARWGIVVFAQDRGASPKDVNVVAISEAVTVALLTDFVGLDVERKPQQVSARNFFGVTIDKPGVAMWGIEFGSEFQLTVAEQGVDDQLDLTSVRSVWDIAPRDNDAPVGEIPEAEESITFAG